MMSMNRMNASSRLSQNNDHHTTNSPVRPRTKPSSVHPIMMKTALLLPFLLVGNLVMNAAATKNSITSTENAAYTKYNHYPQYCSTPEEMDQRAIPPLRMNYSTTTNNGSNDNTTSINDNDQSTTTNNDDDDDTQKTGTQLLHVTALIRHGARTPWASAPFYKCWEGYWDNDETGIWNCDLMTYMSPPSTGKTTTTTTTTTETDTGGTSSGVDADGILEEEPEFLFEKRYDALKFGRDTATSSSTTTTTTTGNELNGTCQLGQLLTRGYDQELSNGQHIRQAYFYDGENTAEEHAASDPRMRLWDLTDGDATTNNGGRRRRAAEANYDNGGGDGTVDNSASPIIIGDPSKQIYQEPNLRYRADDEQRTLMSGQILLRGLFGPELLSSMKNDEESAVIRLHTADFSKDVLEMNSAVCPRLTELQKEAYDSDEFKRWNETSLEVEVVRKFAREKMGLEEIPISMLDCLMTTICTDRTLPAFVNDYDGSLGPTSWDVIALDQSSAQDGESTISSMFERLINYSVKSFTFPLKYNNGAYPKLGMGPLWKEIMSNILPIVDPQNNPSSTPPPKLALFSGHDTTLMPILATLGPNVWSGFEWSPYASMILIELHKVVDSDRKAAFPSGFAFRLIYNGEVLTSKMDKCLATSDLCDVQVLLDQVVPFAKYHERDCALTNTKNEKSRGGFEEKSMEMEMKTAAETLIESPGGVWVVVGLVFVSAALGSVITIFITRRRNRRTYDIKGSLALKELSMTVLDNDDDDDEFLGSTENDHGRKSASAIYGATSVVDNENELI